jgi:hypothetical protein
MREEHATKQAVRLLPPPTGKPRPMPLESVTKGERQSEIAKLLDRDRNAAEDRRS